MVKVWFPTMYMAMVSTRRVKPPAVSQAVFNVPKSMTKTEVRKLSHFLSSNGDW